MEKKYRLSNNSSFRYIFKNGKKTSGEYLIILWVEALSKKVGISVSKKVGNSVVRSRVKRLIKESFRSVLENIGNYNFVAVAKESCARADYHKIKAEIISMLEKQNLYKKGEKNENHL